MRDEVYSTGIWHYGKREGVAPEKFRKPNAERRRTKSSWRMRPQSEWISQKLEGGPIWSKAEHEAIVDALVRNGKVNDGKPAAEDGWDALLKGLLKCGAHVKELGEYCGKAMAPAQKSTPNGRRCWYRCTHRDRVTGQHVCDAASVKAQVIEHAVENGMFEALTVELPDLVSRHRDQIGAMVDTAELERLKVEERRLMGKKNEARDKELYADDAKSKSADLGFDAKDIYMAMFIYSSDAIDPKVTNRRLRGRLGTVAGVDSVTIGHAPLWNGKQQPMAAGSIKHRALISYGAGAYFETLRLPILRGRSFTQAEAERNAPVAIVSEFTARVFWPNRDPLGKQFSLAQDKQNFETIGVARNVRFNDLAEPDEVHVYLPSMEKHSGGLFFRVRGDRQRALEAVRAEIDKIDPQLPPALILVSLEDGPFRIFRAFSKYSGPSQGRSRRCL
jgi:hypothetical protein